MTEHSSVRFSWWGGCGGWGILVHGGAGEALPKDRPDRAEGCGVAARIGAEILRQGGSALDAVQHAVQTLENDPRYNAGTGGALDVSGHLRLDASLMDGSTLAAGAVCHLPPFKNPIAIAREVLNDGRHILYASEGAVEFALQKGFQPEIEENMITNEARERLRAALESGSKYAGTPPPPFVSGGTVGAVAVDQHGNVAAATSTGGKSGKSRGRIGDSPIIGAGTYADNALGAFSGTGDGEGYIRLCAAHHACLLLRDKPPHQAATEVLELLNKRAQALGGAIVATPTGQFGLARTTSVMPWANVHQQGESIGW